MGAGHAHPLYLDRASPLHRLPPEVKIAAMVAFTIVVVATPRHHLWAFGAYALLLVPVAVLGRVPALWLLKRATIELPFVLLAVVLPFAGGGERVTWLGMSLSVDGLYGAWNIVAKGTLGVLASLLLAATTPMRDLINGLDRLRPAIPKGPRSRLTIFGDMAAVLCRNGDFEAALELERIWDDLTRALPFFTVCSYPIDCFENSEALNLLSNVCAAHSAVASGTSRSARAT